jgi:hypothetical protein
MSDLLNNPLTTLLAGPLLSSLAGAAMNQRPSSGRYRIKTIHFYRNV